MKKQHIQLSETDIAYLHELIHAGVASVRVLKRARALMELNQGETIEAVARHQDVTSETIVNLRNRYRAQGLACLQDAPRSGRPPEIDETLRAQIIALAASDAPPGHTRWSLRLLAEQAVELGYCQSISHTQIRNILKDRTTVTVTKVAAPKG